jgi:hypothetical protein
MAMKSRENNRSRQGRIPKALQAIFLASNAGEEVNEPPKNLGFKVFSRLRRTKSTEQVYENPAKNAKTVAPDNDEVRQPCSFSAHPYVNHVLSPPIHLQSKEISKLTQPFPFLGRNSTSTSSGILR